MDILALRTMLRGSWDYPASVFWVRNGFADIIDRMTTLIGLPDTSPPAPAQRRFWGYTATFGRRRREDLQLHPGHRAYEVSGFHRGQPARLDPVCRGRPGSVLRHPPGVRPAVGVKQGWSGWGATVPDEQRCFEDRVGMGQFAGPVPAMKEEPNLPPDLVSPLLHTTGTVGSGERSVVVVFTTYPKDATWPQGAAAVTRLSRSLAPFVPGALPVLQRD